jgi:hypothetical protein
MAASRRPHRGRATPPRLARAREFVTEPDPGRPWRGRLRGRGANTTPAVRPIGSPGAWIPLPRGACGDATLPRLSDSDRTSRSGARTARRDRNRPLKRGAAGPPAPASRPRRRRRSGVAGSWQEVLSYAPGGNLREIGKERITHHASRITHYALRNTHHASRITHYAIRITHHASRITHYGYGIWHPGATENRESRIKNQESSFFAFPINLGSSRPDARPTYSMHNPIPLSYRRAPHPGSSLFFKSPKSEVQGQKSPRPESKVRSPKSTKVQRPKSKVTRSETGGAAGRGSLIPDS